MPRRAAARCGAGSRRPPVKRALPLFVDLPARVLRRLRTVAEVGNHRVDIPLQRALGAANYLLKSGEAAILAQAIELLVRVEHQRRPGKAPCHARAARVKADDEERSLREAECEPPVGRIVADAVVPRVVTSVQFVEVLERPPEKRLERRFVDGCGSTKARYERREFGAEVGYL